MAKAFADIEAGGDAASLGHAEWLALLLEREASLRRNKRLSKRLQYAKLRQQACVEDIDYRTPRGLDRSLLTMLVEGSWIDDHANLLICGPSGVGKSWRASALGNKACRDNRSVLYQRVPRLFNDLALARRSTPPPATTSWRSSRIATAAAPPSSPASCPSINGTR
jgi:DNA replication protein DnaC